MGRTRREGGSALILVAVVTAALTALALGAASLGLMESRAARDGLDSRQAAAAAEGGLRVVKHWFDAPAGSAGAWQVPSPTDVDRSQRRLDPDGDGVFQGYAALAPPWNVLYRQGRDDLFERPYRDDPILAFEGSADGPDLVIARDAGPASSRAFIGNLARSLFGDSGAGGAAIELSRIAIYAPPTALVAGRQVRLGIATIEVSAEVVVRSAAGAAVRAAGFAKGVLTEIPYVHSAALSAASITDGTGLDVRWGAIVTTGPLDLGPDPVTATPSGWPWRSLGMHLVPDAGTDGTLDDTDADGTADFDEWMAAPSGALGDPWFRAIAGGALTGAPLGSSQPYPFDPAAIDASYRTESDRSALFQQIPGGAGLRRDTESRQRALAALRQAAADGGPDAHLLRYVPGSAPPLFTEGGGSALSFEAATRGRAGLFYFDTIDGLPPRDANGDGTLDNLTPPIVVADAGWWAEGYVVINAVTVSLGDSTRAHAAVLSPPGEPFADFDGDGTCGGADLFLRLVYPLDPLAPGASFARGSIAAAAALPSKRSSGPAFTAPVSFAGALIVSGGWQGASAARIFGAIDLGGDLSAPALGGARSLQILYDHRLAEGAWPPGTMRMPRTVWSRFAVGP